MARDTILYNLGEKQTGYYFKKNVYPIYDSKVLQKKYTAESVQIISNKSTL